MPQGGHRPHAQEVRIEDLGHQVLGVRDHVADEELGRTEVPAGGPQLREIGYVAPHGDEGDAESRLEGGKDVPLRVAGPRLGEELVLQAVIVGERGETEPLAGLLELA